MLEGSMQFAEADRAPELTDLILRRSGKPAAPPRSKSGVERLADRPIMLPCGHVWECQQGMSPPPPKCESCRVVNNQP